MVKINLIEFPSVYEKKKNIIQKTKKKSERGKPTNMKIQLI